MNLKNIIAFLAFLHLAVAANAQLILNEVSQGSGSQEYVELLVTGTPSCTNTCVDLRGWIIDDNNGWHAAGSGVGIADGCMRFKNVPIWSCVKIGTIIVVYNANDRNPLIPADDLSDTDGNCRLIIPHSNTTLFDHDTVRPNTSSASYTTFINTGPKFWASMMGMRNGGDAFHTVSPANINVPHHSITWGDNGSSDIYFAGSASALSYYMGNLVNDDPFFQDNWVSGSVGSTAETPGVPNNTANATWITSLNNNCQNVTTIVANITGDTTICVGENTSLTATGGASYLWSTGATTATITVNPTTNTKYKVTVTQGICNAEDSITVIVNALPLINLGSDVTICSSDNITITASGANQYIWNTGATTAAITVSPAISTTYIVTGTNASQCFKSDTIQVLVSNSLVAQISGDTSICIGESTQLTVSGGSIYSWSTGATTTSINVSPIVNTTYTVTVSSPSGCADTVSKFVLVNGLPVANAGSDQTICEGASATLTASGGLQYGWSTGATTSSITVQPTQTSSYIVTATNSFGCTDTDTVVINIQQLQLNLSLNTTNENCPAANDGSVVVIASPNGNYSYTFEFNGSAIGTNTTGSLNNLQPGTYNVIVDAGGNCFVTGNFEIEAATDPNITINTTAPTCFLSSVNDGSITVNGGGNSFQYSLDNINFQPSNEFLNLSSGSYTVYVAGGSCNYTFNTVVPNAETVTLQVQESVELIKGSSKVVNISLSSPSYTLDISPATGLSCTDCLNPVVSGIENNTTYVVTATNGNCVLTDSFTVFVVEKEVIVFPTAFTPNNDNLNDFFRPSHSGTINNYSLKVYNRWGEKLFESNLINIGWDGFYRDELQPIETYVWYCTYADFKNEEKLLKGNLTLIK
jgi:gliding motility-associated-like protein